MELSIGLTRDQTSRVVSEGGGRHPVTTLKKRSRVGPAYFRRPRTTTLSKTEKLHPTGVVGIQVKTYSDIVVKNEIPVRGTKDLIISL